MLIMRRYYCTNDGSNVLEIFPGKFLGVRVGSVDQHILHICLNPEQRKNLTQLLCNDYKAGNNEIKGEDKAGAWEDFYCDDLDC